MGITQLIDSYYVREGLDTSPTRLAVGQFGWAPVPFVSGSPWIMDAVRADPTNHHEIAGTVRPVKADDFRERKELPLKLLGLRAHERLMVAKAKRRPCVILAIKHRLSDPRLDAPRHVTQSTLVVAPAYHAQVSEEDNGIPPKTMALIRALVFPWYFPLKASGSPKYEIVPGAVRLENAFPVVPGDAGAFEPMRVALAPDSLAVLRALHQEALGFPTAKELADLREVATSCLPVELRPIAPTGAHAEMPAAAPGSGARVPPRGR